LILNEATCVQDFATLTFGLLAGWWLYDDPSFRLKGSPLLSPSLWDSVLSKEGFQKRYYLSGNTGTEPLPQHIIIAESDGLITQPVSEENQLANEISGSSHKHKQQITTAHSDEDRGEKSLQNALVETALSISIQENSKNVFTPTRPVFKLIKPPFPSSRMLDSILGPGDLCCAGCAGNSNSSVGLPAYFHYVSLRYFQSLIDRIRLS